MSYMFEPGAFLPALQVTEFNEAESAFLMERWFPQLHWHLQPK